MGGSVLPFDLTRETRQTVQQPRFIGTFGMANGMGQFGQFTFGIG